MTSPTEPAQDTKFTKAIQPSEETNPVELTEQIEQIKAPPSGTGESPYFAGRGSIIKRTLSCRKSS
jgi:hypothetical protein